MERKIDHIKILKFSKENPDLSFHKISKSLKINIRTIIGTINGMELLYHYEIDEIKKLGYNICRACGCRIVPKKIIGNTKLSILCFHCFKDPPGDLIENPVHISHPNHFN